MRAYAIFTTRLRVMPCNYLEVSATSHYPFDPREAHAQNVRISLRHP